MKSKQAEPVNVKFSSIKEKASNLSGHEVSMRLVVQMNKYNWCRLLTNSLEILDGIPFE